MTGLKAILFDYGHTLVYFPHIQRTHWKALRNVQNILTSLNVPSNITRILTIIDYYAHHSKHVLNMEDEFQAILTDLGVETVTHDDVSEAIQGFWKPWIKNVRLRTGVKTLLHSIQHMKLRLGLVGNCWSEGMNPVLKREGIDTYFDVVVASVDAGYRKPDPHIFQTALDQLGFPPSEAMMVGDTPQIDIHGAHQLGMTTVRLLRGPNRRKPDVVEPTYRIRNLSSLQRILKDLICHE